MMPIAFRQMEKFEQLIKVRVNVFRNSIKKLIPFRISNNRNFSFNLDLLLLSDRLMHHYVLITNIRGLILDNTSVMTIICVVTVSISALHWINMGDMKKIVIKTRKQL